eukprot:1366439-Amorphochlora_amoeboformis.AAC.4
MLAIVTRATSSVDSPFQCAYVKSRVGLGSRLPARFDIRLGPKRSRGHPIVFTSRVRYGIWGVI